MVVVELWICDVSHRYFRVRCCSLKGHSASEPKYHKSFMVQQEPEVPL